MTRVCWLSVCAALVACGPLTGTDMQNPSAGEVASSERGLFADEAPLHFEIRAPFKKINDLDRSMFSEGELDDGELVIAGKHVPMKLGPRGRTSFLECKFRKLEVDDVDLTAALGTAFAGMKAFKVGTHCDLLNEGSLYGRLGTEEATYRERLAYRWYEALSPMSLRTRLAVITYVSTDAPNEAPFTRKALLLEDPGVFRRRIGGERLEIAEVKLAKLDPTVLATSYLFQLLIGNFDWQIGGMFRGGIAPEPPAGAPGFNNETTWNYRVYRTATTDVPVPYDYDIARLVNGTQAEPWGGHAAFLPSRSDDVRELAADLVGFWRMLPDDPSRNAAVKAVMDARATLEARIEEGQLDAEGEVIARERLASFFEAWELLPSLRVLERGPLTLFAAPSSTTPFCTRVAGAFPIVVTESQGQRVAFQSAQSAFDSQECEGLPHGDFNTVDQTFWIDQTRVLSPF